MRFLELALKISREHFALRPPLTLPQMMERVSLCLYGPKRQGFVLHLADMDPPNSALWHLKI